MRDGTVDGWTVSAVILGVVAFIAWIVAYVILNGFVVSVLWGWFVVPIFGLPTLSIAQAIGIVMIVSALTHPYARRDKEKPLWLELVEPFISVPIVLGIGWVIHLYV